MVTDIDVIDNVLYDKHRTLKLVIYDMKSIVDSDLERHEQCMKDKVKAYVQAIQNGQIYELFKLKEGKKYQFYIEVLIDQVPGPWYMDFLNWLDENVSHFSNGAIRVRLYQ